MCNLVQVVLKTLAIAAVMHFTLGEQLSQQDILKVALLSAVVLALLSTFGVTEGFITEKDAAELVKAQAKERRKHQG